MAGKDKPTPKRNLQHELGELQQAWSESARGQHPAEPPEMIDLAVLNTARRALDEESRGSLAGRFSGRWPSLLGTAALMALTLSILINRWPDTPIVELAAPKVEGAMPAVEPAVPKVERAIPGESSLRKQDAAHKSIRQRNVLTAEIDGQVTDESFGHASMEESEQMELRDADPARDRSDYRRAAVEENKAGEIQGGEREVRESEVGEIQGREIEAGKIQLQDARFQDIDGEDSKKNIPVEVDALHEFSADSAERDGQDKDTSGPRSQTEAAAEAIAPDNYAAPKGKYSAVRQDPASWIAHIRLLMDNSEQAQAVQEIEAFRQVWPDYPVPDDLNADIMNE